MSSLCTTIVYTRPNQKFSFVRCTNVYLTLDLRHLRLSEDQDKCPHNPMGKTREAIRRPRHEPDQLNIFSLDAL